MNKKINVIDLFAGAGGLSYGFYHNQAYKILAANEIESDMCSTYKTNHKDVPVYCSDIKDFSMDLLNNDLGINKDDVDVIIGGPPCQAYSTVGKRLLDDPRGKLFQEYYRIVKEADPKVFLFENVKGLLSMDKGNLLKTIISLFEGIGYKVKYKVLNAVDYGVPQYRERVIIVGFKTKKEYAFPESTHCNIDENKPNYLTLSDALSDLPRFENGGEATSYVQEPTNDFQRRIRNNADSLSEHFSPKNNDNLVRLMKALPDGGTPQDLPETLRPKSGFKNTYARLWWNQPSTTITRNFGTPSSSRCIHPKDPRPLSTREAARLQTFPDDYVFCGAKGSKNLQIGNAVPVELSKVLAKSIFDFLEMEELDDNSHQNNSSEKAVLSYA